MATNFMNDAKMDERGWEVTGKITQLMPAVIDLDKDGRLMVFYFSDDDGADINGAVLPLDRGWGVY
jgi:hypothetical protein